MTITRDRLALILLIALGASFLALCAWLSPGGRGQLSASEVDAYIERLAGHLPASAEEEAEFLRRLRGWGEADDGQPVYMLNVMSYFAELHHVPGDEAVRGTPAEANATYERAVMPMLLRLGAFPVFAGQCSGVRIATSWHKDIIGAVRGLDECDRVLVVRYPNRRAFFRLISDPGYFKIAPYKFASLTLSLVPIEAQANLPDPRWVAGALLLCVALAAGWWRAARRAPAS